MRRTADVCLIKREIHELRNLSSIGTYMYVVSNHLRDLVHVLTAQRSEMVVI